MLTIGGGGVGSTVLHDRAEKKGKGGDAGRIFVTIAERASGGWVARSGKRKEKTRREIESLEGSCRGLLGRTGPSQVKGRGVGNYDKN